MPSLQETLSILKVDPLAAGLQIVGAEDQRVDPRVPALIALGGASLESTLERLRGLYPPSWCLRLITPEGGVFEATLEGLSPSALERSSYLFVPALPWREDLRSFSTLVEIVAWLRAPEGCPWDRAQTHESIAPYLLEETYEVLESLDKGEAQELPGELGDVLLQVLLHSQMAREEGVFTVEEVVEALASKLVRRHPHVFGDAVAETAEEVAANWEVIKSQERGGASLLEGVPATLPALGQAQRVQERAAGARFDWEEVEGIWRKVQEELEEYARAASPEERAGELGDILFSLVNLGRRQGLDVEGALRQANRRFVERFRLMEEMASQRGLSFPDLPLAEKDVLWEEAKRTLGQTSKSYGA